MPTSSRRSRKLLETRKRFSSSFSCFRVSCDFASALATRVIWQIAKQPAQCEQAEQITMAVEFTGNSQQILLKNSGLTVGHNQGG